MPTGANRVKWDLVDPTAYEDMVAVLLSYLHPDLVRIDGKGGDGGRDCYWDTDSGREAFELKSFGGRMGTSQRQQVVRSLKRAAAHNPVIWHLVVPIDPTPGEDAWFDGLRDSYPFPLKWRGKTWLDGHMASKPYLYRYFVEGAAEEVLERLIELKAEEAGLADGVPDAIDRLERIRQRLNEIDPYYRFSVAVTPQGHTVSIEPRYAGAANDRPIRRKIFGVFPETDQGLKALSDLREALAFGLPYDLEPEYIEAVDLDAPGGVGGRLTGVSMSIRPAKDDVSVKCVLQVHNTDGVLLAQLPIVFRTRTSGAEGQILSGSDSSGWLEVTIRLNFVDRRVDFSYRTQLEGDELPGDLLPALAFVSVFHRQNLFSASLPDFGATIASDLPIETEPIIEANHRRLLEDLALLQQTSGVFFELPERLSSFDMREIEEGVRLLAGESVPMAWPNVTMTINPVGGEPAVIRQAAESGEAWIGGMTSRNEVAIDVAGHFMSLGHGWTVYPAVRISNRDEVLAAWQAGATEIPVDFDCLKPPVMTVGEPPGGLPKEPVDPSLKT